MESDPPLAQLEDLLGELAEADEEHTDVSVQHENGWCLSAFRRGLVWENIIESDSVPRHMRNVPNEKIIELWTKLAHGEIEIINSEPWLDGYY